MNIHRSEVVTITVAALSGVIVCLGLILAYGALAGVIEPQGRIEAFLNARPVHRHPLQLAAVAWLLHVLGGAFVGVVVARIGRIGQPCARRSDRRTPHSGE